MVELNETLGNKANFIIFSVAIFSPLIIAAAYYWFIKDRRK